VLARLRFQGQRLPFYGFKATLNLVPQSEGLTETCSLQNTKQNHKEILHTNCLFKSALLIKGFIGLLLYRFEAQTIFFGMN
jgi:hypothetical protein